MTCSRPIVILSALTLATALSLSALAQDDPGNIYNGEAGDDQFDTQGNWNEGGPASWTEDPAGTWDLEGSGGENQNDIGFDLDEDGTYTINVGGNAYENMGDLSILSRSAITLIGMGTDTYFQFEDDSQIHTGLGAMHLQGIELQLGGNFTFNYGSGDEDDPAMTINQTVGTQSLDFNLIIDGAINDGEGGFGSETLTFSGNGFALLTGGITGGHEGAEDDEPKTEWTLVMNDAASLMLAGGASFYLGKGVEMDYSGGSKSLRENGHGILQVTDGATLDTTANDAGTPETDGDISLAGWSALLVGNVDLDDSEVEDLGFNVDTDTTTIGYTTGDGTVTTNNMTLSGDSAVVVGDGGSVTGEKLAVTSRSTYLIQDGGESTFKELDLAAAAATVINYGTLNITDAEKSPENGGTFISGGTTNISGGFVNDNTLEVVGGLFTIDKGAIFRGTTSVTGGILRSKSNFGLEGTMTLDGGDVEAATYQGDGAEEQEVVELKGDLKINTGSRFWSHGDTTVEDTVYINGGTFQVGSDTDGSTETDLNFQLAGESAEFGGWGELLIHNTDGLLVQNSTFFVGQREDPEGYSAGVLSVQGGDIDAQTGRMEFAVEVDEDGNQAANGESLGGASYLQMNGGTVTFGADSVLGIGVSGDNYIEDGTMFFLVDSTEDWNDIMTIEELQASNSVTRRFTILDEAGYIEMTSNYTEAAGQYYALGNWVGQSAATSPGAGSNLAHQFDQISTASAYQYALRQLQPVTFASGLQVVADTQHFSVLREAASGLNNGKSQSKPGPARRPLGQLSESLLASQDEGDAVRSRYGYGIGPDAGERRSQSSDIVAFAQGYGRWVDLDNKGGVLGLNGNEWGIVAGAAGNLSDEWMLGALVGYDSFDGTLNDNAGSVDVQTIRVGPFVNWSDGTWIFDASVAGAWNDWNGTQQTGLAANPSYTWDTQGYQIDGSVGLGYTIPVGGGVDIIPEGSVVYSWIHTDGYTGSTGVSVDTDDLNAIIGRAGARAQFNVISGLILEGRAGWQGNYTFGGDISTTFQNVATPIPSTVDAVNRNTIYYGAQVTWMPDWNLALTLRYEGRNGDGTNDQYIAGGLSIEF